MNTQPPTLMSPPFLKSQISNFKFQILLLLPLLALVSAGLQAQEATARFAPARIFIDETSTYEVTLSGVQSVSGINIHQPDGLEFISQSQRSNLQTINGRTSVALDLSFGARATRPGTYTIPSFRIGQTTVPAATLEVMPLTEERQRQLEEEERRQREAQREVIGMELEIPEGDIYVGQAIPVTLNIYSHGSLFAQPTSRPTTDTDAFIHTSFGDQPEQNSTLRQGRRYNEYTWKTILTPVKTGSVPLQFKENFVVGQGFFNRQQLELATDEITLDILPLPTLRKPDSFSGAIGTFSLLRPEIDTDTVREGEPLTLRITINGEGNFARIGAPALRDTDGWRTYPPEEKFRPEGGNGLLGSKTFEYIIIPQHTDLTHTPQVAFSYFNPEDAEYIELSPPALPIEVIPAPPGSQPAFGPGQRVSTTERGPTLLPLMPTLGTTVSHISPIITHPAFIASQAIPALALASLVIIRRRQRRLSDDPAYARRLRLLRIRDQHLQAATQAVREQNHRTYFDEARHTLQATLGLHLSPHEPFALTLHDCEALLARHSLADPDTLACLRDCFEKSDALTYGGIAPSDLNLDQELQRLLQTLSHLDPSR